MQAVADRARDAAGEQRVRRLHARMLAQGIADSEVTRRIMSRLLRRP